MSIYKKCEEILNQADAVVISAGAGMGVDSGLPDFRGDTGFWKAYPVISKMGIKFTEMANPEWFETKPELAWAFYGHRLNLYRKTIPHKGFGRLLEYGKNLPLGYFVYTSNVDGQFQKAGFSSDKIEEIHGSIHHFQCTMPCCSKIWEAPLEEINIDNDKFEAIKPFPACPFCGAVSRPNILMFGDWHWLSERSNNQSQKFSLWLNEIKKSQAKLVVVEIGAGKAVPSVRRKSESLADFFNGQLIRINRDAADIPNGINGVEFQSTGLEAILSIL
jgi:NAD-dependent SIR2 family protein deacetylase